MTKKLFCCSACILFLLCACVQPDPSFDSNKLNRGIEAYRKQDHVTALSILRPLADLGNADAMVFVGEIYLSDSGVKIDKRLALQYFEMAATLGHANGQYHAGLMKLQQFDVGDAMRLFEKAVSQNHLFAKHELANILAYGPSEIRDNCRALALYESAGHSYVPAARAALTLREKSGANCPRLHENNQKK